MLGQAALFFFPSTERYKLSKVWQK